MSRPKPFIIYLWLIFLVIPLVHSSNAQKRKPNIILIVSEDNSADLGCYDNPVVHTPNLDRLAEKGVRFTNAYASYSVCSPSRSSIFTGLYPHQNGQLGWATHHYALYEDMKVLPQYLKGTGYKTGFMSKIHVNPEESFEFDFTALPGSNFQKKDLQAYAANAKKFIEQSVDEPYFLMVNFPDAHLPFQNDVDGLPTVKVDAGKITSTLPFVGVNTPRLRKETEAYFNCINRLDESIGMLLESMGDLSNTCIIYLSDHGAQFSRGKLTNYEGGLKIPFIMYWPEVLQDKGIIKDELISVIDILPTIMDMTGIKIPEYLPGRSLLELFDQKKNSPGWREYLGADGEGASPVFYYPRRSIRNERYKLIYNIDVGRKDFPAFHAYADPKFPSGATVEEISKAEEKIQKAFKTWKNPPEWELYDLENDPWEFENLSEDSAYQEILKKMQRAMLAWRQQTKDPFLDKNKLERFTAEMDSVNNLYPDHSYRNIENFKWNYLEYLK